MKVKKFSALNFIVVIIIVIVVSEMRLNQPKNNHFRKIFVIIINDGKRFFSSPSTHKHPAIGKFHYIIIVVVDWIGFNTFGMRKISFDLKNKTKQNKSNQRKFSINMTRQKQNGVKTIYIIKLERNQSFLSHTHSQ